LTSRTAETLNSRVNFRRAIAVAPLDRLYPVRPERTRFVGKVIVQPVTITGMCPCHYLCGAGTSSLIEFDEF
jgi:hypothetical protein